MSIIAPGKFLSSTNLTQTAFQIPEFGILALAMMIVMITGGIDLSIIATANVSGIIAAIVLVLLTSPGSSDLSALLKGIMANEAAQMMNAQHVPFDIRMLSIILLTVLSAIFVGGICGILNGLLVSLVRIPPILATLGTIKLFEGISLAITKGSPITNFPPSFLYLGSGSLFHIPVPLLIFIICIVLVTLLLRKTILGFNMYAIGENPIAARFSGVPNTTVLLRTYLISGLLAGMAAIVIMSRVDSVKVGYGSSYLLQTVLVAILGGVSVRGGTGNVSGVVLGILLLRTIESGFNLAGFSNYLRNVIWGTLLIAVAIVNSVYPMIRVDRRSKVDRYSEKTKND